MKICTKCGKEKTLGLFHRDKSKSDGYRPNCKECVNRQSKEYYESNQEKVLGRTTKYYYENRERLKLKQVEYRKKRDKEVTREYYREWRKKNKGRCKAYKIRRELRHTNSTPVWLNEKHHTEIEYIYKLRDEAVALTGDWYNVDHIIPLQGKTVCGLHVPWNLQVLPEEMNKTKSNLWCWETQT